MTFKIFKIIGVFIVVVALVSLPACAFNKKKPAETGTQADTGEALSLAARYCPVFYLPAEDVLQENYEPASVDFFIDQTVFHHTEDKSFSLKATLQSMTKYFASSYYLDVPDISPSDTTVLTRYKELYDSSKPEAFAPTVYARIIEQSSAGYTIVQYWIFYYFNDWRDVHEGDWELIELVFPALPVADILTQNTEPLFAAYSQHQTGQKMAWPAMKQQGVVAENHPRVYVARGSHANYFNPGQFWSILDFDDTGLSSWKEVRPENIVLLQESGSADDQRWLDFQGRWGELCGFSVSVRGLTFGQSGPTGPMWSGQGKKSLKWENPYAWAFDLPEYPDPFWTSFFPEWAKNINTLTVFSVYSPADIHVYDSKGRHVGLNKKGGLDVEIEGAEYIEVENTGYKIIVIPEGDSSQHYKLVLKGKGQGKMDVIAKVPDVRNKSHKFTRYTDIPVNPKVTAMLDFEPETAVATQKGGSVRDKETLLKIDTDGDNLFDAEIKPGGKKILPIEPEEIPDILPAPANTTPIETAPVITPSRTTSPTVITR